MYYTCQEQGVVKRGNEEEEAGDETIRGMIGYDLVCGMWYDDEY